jgi:hypothetical protein
MQDQWASARWRRGAAIAAFAAAGLAMPGSARAQRTVTQATLEGVVEDPSGAVVSGATVEAQHEERGQVWRAGSDERGRFRFLALPLGRYALVTARQGFATRRQELELSVGQALDLRVRLSVATLEQAVDVHAERPLLETVRTQMAERVSPAEVRELPLNGRHYLDLAALVPGVSRANPVSNQRFPETSAVPGTGISVAGQRQINNTFVVDGLSANDDAADLPGTFYSQEVIREFQVITGGGIAEFGRASGGVVNIVTRSGGNRWEGEGYGFFRDEALDARDPLALRKDPQRQWQYGLTAAGPLRRDRTFIFANVEQTRLDRSGTVTVPAATAAAVNARLAAAGYAGPPLETGPFRTGYDSTNLLARLDHQLRPGMQLAVRYSLYDIASPNARNVGGINAPSRGTALEDRDHTLALTLLATASPRTLNETRLQATRSSLASPPNDLHGPAVNIAGVANLGTATFSPTERRLDLLELANVTTTIRGAHALKAGVDVLWDRLHIAFPGAVQGVYTFASLAEFQAGRYVTFQQAFGDPEQFQSNPNLGLFVQDEWRLRGSLTANLGLRYDLQFLPGPIRTDADNLSPRAGLAWAPGEGRTVVRASAGLFFDRLPLRATSNALQRDGTRYRVAVVPFGTPAAPSFPRVLDAFPEELLASVTTIDPDIQNASTVQLGTQVERQLGRRTTVAVGYLHTTTRGLIVSRNVNVPTLSAAAAAAAGIPNLGRPDPTVANNGRFGSLGRGRYDGVTLSLRHDSGRRAGGRLSYTLSDARDDAGNAFFFTPQDSRDLAAEWGPSDNDQRHRLVVSGWAAVKGFRLSAIFSYGSALPFNVLTGNDRNSDTNVNDRPAGVGRNSERGFDSATLDVRLSRVLHVGRAHAELLVEGFNVLNRSNLQLPNGVFGAGTAPRPGFGAATAAAAGRQIQIGLRVGL